MSATTICLPDELKAHVADTARRTGSTTHDVIPDAITEKDERTQLRRDSTPRQSGDTPAS